MNKKPFSFHFLLVILFILTNTLCFAQTDMETIDDVKSKYPELEQYNEATLNNLGYQLIKQNKTEQAIEVFKFNCRTYSQSWNTYDSLGEAYMINRETELAILNYEKNIRNLETAFCTKCCFRINIVEDKKINLLPMCPV